MFPSVDSLQCAWPRRRDQHAEGAKIFSLLSAIPQEADHSSKFREDLKRYRAPPMEVANSFLPADPTTANTSSTVAEDCNKLPSSLSAVISLVRRWSSLTNSFRERACSVAEAVALTCAEMSL